MPKQENLQDLFLNAVRRDRTPLTVFLANGYQIKGTVTGFDSFVVMVNTEGKQQMIYKSSISTICPIRAVMMSEENNAIANGKTE